MNFFICSNSCLLFIVYNINDYMYSEYIGNISISLKSYLHESLILLYVIIPIIFFEVEIFNYCRRNYPQIMYHI